METIAIFALVLASLTSAVVAAKWEHPRFYFFERDKPFVLQRLNNFERRK